MFLKRAAAKRPAPPTPRPPGRVAAVAKQFDGRYPPPPGRPTAEAAAALARVFANNRDWQSLPPSVWRDACWLMWVGPVPLAGYEPFVTAYLGWLKGEGRRPAWVRAVHAYLTEFQPSRPGIAELGRLLAAEPERTGLAWSRRHARYRLFDPLDGPLRVARAVLTARTPVPAALAQCGLDGALATGGFAAAAFERALGVLDGEDAALIAKLLDRLEPWGVRDGRLVYPDSRRALVESLVAPWLEKAPPVELRQRIAELIDRAIGDPRRTPERFADIREPVVKLLATWMMLAAIERYLPLVEALGFENDWAFRRSFWLAYLKAGAVLDADVLEPQRGRPPASGRYDAGTGSQIVLLLRMPGLVVSDWSHNGRCYWWKEGSPHAPKFHRAGHTRESLTAGAEGGGITHARAEGGVWQRRVAEAIRQAGGPDLGPRQYMPPGWSP